MKKILTAILLLFAINMSAQIQQQQDTLRITMIDGSVKDFISGDITKLDYSDPSVVNVNLWDGTNAKIERKSIKSIRFYNRYSNPKVLLQVQTTGAYEGLYYSTANPTGDFFFISSLASDEMLGGGGEYDNFMAIDLLTVNESLNNSLSSGWDTYYQSIYNINTMINLLNFLPRDVKKEEADHAHGEALFLRAYYYYQLASLFGNIPIITNNESWKEKISTTTPLEVWGRILQDLKDAIKLLDGYSPTLTIDDSRVGKYAAEALLARAYLFYTGFYMGVHDIANGTADVTLPDGSSLTKADVVSYLNDCITNSGFSLVPDYRNLWSYTNRYTVDDYDYTKDKSLRWVENDGAINPEVLFKIKYNTYASWGTTAGYSNQFALFFGMRFKDNSGVFPFGRGWGAGTVAPNLYQDWSEAEPQDIRRDASIQDVNQLPHYLYGGSYNDYVQETQYHEKKNSPISARDENGYAETFEKLMYGQDGWVDYNFQLGNTHPLNIIRYADVLLMHSELTGTTDGMNQVRRRAELSPISTYSLSALQQERRWELAFEGVRWNDMRRWGDDYCMAALDKQMDQPIYNGGIQTTNPLGVPTYEADARPYSAHYAESRGFFAKPEAYQKEGAMVTQKLLGFWTYDDGDRILLDYINIIDGGVLRYDPAGNEVANGTITFTPTENYDQRICQITFSDGCMLPMSKKYSEAEGTMTYDLISLSDDAMVLKVDGKELKLRRIDSNTTLINQIHGIKWSYGTYTGKNWNTGDEVTFGTYGLSSWEEPYRSQNLPSIGGIYDPYIKGTAASDLTSFVKANNMSVGEGETDPFAYMVFDLYNNTIKKYTADGKLINTGTFILNKEGSLMILKTSENATLVPYMYNGKNEITKEFLLRYNPYQSELAERTSPILSLRSMSLIDDMNTFWMFGQRGLTSDEFEKTLIVQRQEKDGTPSETGRFLSLNMDRERFIIYVEDAETGMQMGKVQDNSPFEYYVPSGQTVTKQLRFRLKNCNNIDAVTERTFTFTNADPLPEEMVILAGEASKSWTWDTSITGAVWGDMGYCGGAGSVVGTQFNSQWWGVTSTDEFNGQLQQTEDGINHGDGDLNAYMTFGTDGILNSYDKDGNLIRTGSFRVNDYDNSDPSAWRVGMLNTNAILWPYEFKSGGNIPGNYEIVYLTNDKMTLVYPENGNFGSLGSWGQATFWHFKAKE